MLCPCIARRKTGRNILFLAPFFPRTVAPLLWRCRVYLFFSLLLSLSIFDDAQPRRVLFYSRSDFSRSTPIQQRRCWRMVLSRALSLFLGYVVLAYPSLRDRYRSHRQHFRRHVFEPCIFIPLKQTILLPRLETLDRSDRAWSFIRPLGSLPFVYTETAQPWASIVRALL